VQVEALLLAQQQAVVPQQLPVQALLALVVALALGLEQVPAVALEPESSLPRMRNLASAVVHVA